MLSKRTLTYLQSKSPKLRFRWKSQLLKNAPMLSQIQSPITKTPVTWKPRLSTFGSPPKKFLSVGWKSVLVNGR